MDESLEPLTMSIKTLLSAVAFAGLIALGMLVATLPGQAFTSCYQLVGKVSIKCISGHYTITTDALNQLSPPSRPSPSAILRVASADEGVDRNENELRGITILPFGVIIAPKLSYDPSHHFDRDIDSNDTAAFLRGLAFVNRERAVVLQRLAAGCQATGQALDALGASLHALQDVYSHSNYAEELDAGARAEVNATLANGGGAIPAALKLTLYDRDPPSGDWEDPLGPDGGPIVGKCPVDQYCHQGWSKDFPNKDDLTTPPSPFYNVAYEAAVAATKAFVQNIIVASGPNWQNVVRYGTQAAGCQPPPCPPCLGGTNNGGPPPTIHGTSVTSGDPNDKAGSLGTGTLQYVSTATPLRYAIEFSNEPTASAAAQRVVVTDPIDRQHVDLSTLRLGPITIDTHVVIPPPESATFAATIDLRPSNNLLVAVKSELNASTGVLTWTFQSLDPETHQPPDNPLAGFLPPGTGGSVFFAALPVAGIATNTQIQNQATIVFDTNAGMKTPVWLNTMDGSTPTSQVESLPATEPSMTFPVQWAGTDIGSGVQSFTIYVSDNGGAFDTFLVNTDSTTAMFTGQPGHTYGFYSIARDAVGNIEPSKSGAETTTRVPIDTTPPDISLVATPSVLWPPNGKPAAVIMSGRISDAGSGVNEASVKFAVADEYSEIQPSGTVALGNDGTFRFVLQLEASRLGTDHDGRLYRIVVSGQDNAGNIGVASATVIVPHDAGH